MTGPVLEIAWIDFVKVDGREERVETRKRLSLEEIERAKLPSDLVWHSVENGRAALELWKRDKQEGKTV